MNPEHPKKRESHPKIGGGKCRSQAGLAVVVQCAMNRKRNSWKEMG
jgi:hypothetical protein